MPVPPLPLVAEAARRSRVCWLSYDHPGGSVRDRLAWHAWHDDALVVLSGVPPEQRLEGLAEAAVAEVVLRSRHTRARLVGWSGRVEVVPPAARVWAEHAGALLGVRLNLPDPAAALDLWRETATIVRLTPAVEPRQEQRGALH